MDLLALFFTLSKLSIHGFNTTQIPTVELKVLCYQKPVPFKIHNKIADHNNYYDWPASIEQDQMALSRAKALG